MQSNETIARYRRRSALAQRRLASGWEAELRMAVPEASGGHAQAGDLKGRLSAGPLSLRPAPGLGEACETGDGSARGLDASPQQIFCAHSPTSPVR